MINTRIEAIIAENCSYDDIIYNQGLRNNPVSQKSRVRLSDFNDHLTHPELMDERSNVAPLDHIAKYST